MSAEPENKGPVIGIRHLQALLLFLAICVNFIARNTVSVALVAMTNAASANLDFEEYDWTEAQKSYILSSFYWGYVVTQFPAGLLARQFGCKVMLLFPTVITTLCTVLTPYFISWGGWEAYCALRVILGLSQGLIIPAIFGHVAKWSPPKDRNNLGSIAYMGSSFGLLIAMAISGLIAESSMGWPGIFYVTAGICAVWCILWIIFAADNAPSSRWVTQAERDYIERSMKREDGFHVHKIPVPWRSILTSVPFYALLIVSSAQGWTASMMNQQTPAYIHGVLEMNIKENALYSALPYLASWGMVFVYMLFADFVISRNWMSLGVMRKTVNTMASWGPAAALVAIGFLDKDQTAWAIALMTIKSGLGAGIGIGSVINVIDLSPNHSGMMMGITNACATILSMLTSITAGLIVTDSSSREQWQIVFGLTAAVFFVGNLIYIIWGSTDLQPWDAADFLKPRDVELNGDKATLKEREALKALETKTDKTS